jgi:hypothetical protein
MENASFRFASAGEALAAAMSGMKYLAESDAASLPATVIADCVRGLEKLDAAEAVARGRLLWMFDADRGWDSEGYGGIYSFVRFGTRVTKGQAKLHAGLVRFRAVHPPFEQALLDGCLSLSVARRVGQLTARIEDDQDRGRADQMLALAAAAGADEHELMVLAAAVLEKLAPPDPDGPYHDRDLRLETTFGGAGVLRGDLTPECGAPRGALSYRPRSGRRLEEVSVGLMAYLDP